MVLIQTCKAVWQVQTSVAPISRKGVRGEVGDDYLDILHITFLPEPADDTTIHTENSLLYMKLKFKLFQLIVYAFSCIYAHLAVVTAPFCHTGAACFSHSGGYKLRNCCCGQAPMQDELLYPSAAATEAL